MVELAYGIIIFGFLFLGVKLWMKLREIASWKSEEPPERMRPSDSIPRELLDLTIEDSKNELGSLDGIDEKKSDQK
ncbi:MAG: hypothetical protein NTU47_09685 [Ignavibacteriales bacterium]|nr:hypothetical protein [Ignavibacteriales bacterium]